MAAASGLSLELVRDFLMNQRCRVEYKQLVLQFKPFLFDAGSRDLFKDIVNKIADVTQEGSTKYIVLKPAFYFNLEGGGGQRASLVSSSSSSATGVQDPRRSFSSSSSSDGHGSGHHHVTSRPMPGRQISAVQQPPQGQQQPMIGHHQPQMVHHHPPQLPSRGPPCPGHGQVPYQIPIQQQMQRQMSQQSIQQNMVAMNRQSMSTVHPMQQMQYSSSSSMAGLPQNQQYYQQPPPQRMVPVQQQQQQQQFRPDNYHQQQQRNVRTGQMVPNEYQVPVMRSQLVPQEASIRRNPPSSLPLTSHESFNEAVMTVTAIPYNPQPFNGDNRNPPTGPKDPPPAVPTSPTSPSAHIQWSPTNPLNGQVPPQPPPRRRASMASSSSSTLGTVGNNGSKMVSSPTCEHSVSLTPSSTLSVSID